MKKILLLNPETDRTDSAIIEYAIVEKTEVKDNF